MPTFCRHNRFIERCPICSKTLPGAEPARGPGEGRSKRAAAGSSSSARGRSATARGRRLRGGRDVRVHREDRAQEDGYEHPLLPGLRSSADAARLAEEIAFASARLLRIHSAPPSLFNEIRTLAGDGQLERATWLCFLTVYLSPLQGDDPFAGVRLVLEREGDGSGSGDAARREGSPLDGVPLGPRTSHDPARGSETVHAYRQWALHAGSQVQGLLGEASWTPGRRFERAFERLALPGFPRMGRYELLVTLGRLGLYEMQADSLHLAVGRAGLQDATTVAAKRVLAVGDPIYLERRASAFAAELDVPIDVLDLALANWGTGERATLGFKADITDRHALERARTAFDLDDLEESISD
jgi:Alpha-glutamyl/putrescinyl thymine pyrophosphorylase clade 3